MFDTLRVLIFLLVAAPALIFVVSYVAFILIGHLAPSHEGVNLLGFTLAIALMTAYVTGRFLEWWPRNDAVLPVLMVLASAFLWHRVYLLYKYQLRHRRR